MIISINDHPDIRQLFADLPMVEVDYKYTVGGGQNQAECKELIYGTWPGGVPKPREQQTTIFEAF
jgi:DNA adenine methylase